MLNINILGRIEKNNGIIRLISWFLIEIRVLGTRVIVLRKLKFRSHLGPENKFYVGNQGTIVHKELSEWDMAYHQRKVRGKVSFGPLQEEKITIRIG